MLLSQLVTSGEYLDCRGTGGRYWTAKGGPCWQCGSHDTAELSRIFSPVSSSISMASRQHAGVPHLPGVLPSWRQGPAAASCGFSSLQFAVQLSGCCQVRRLPCMHLFHVVGTRPRKGWSWLLPTLGLIDQELQEQLNRKGLTPPCFARTLPACFQSDGKGCVTSGQCWAARRVEVASLLPPRGATATLIGRLSSTICGRCILIMQSLRALPSRPATCKSVPKLESHFPHEGAVELKEASALGAQTLYQDWLTDLFISWFRREPPFFPTVLELPLAWKGCVLQVIHRLLLVQALGSGQTVSGLQDAHRYHGASG